MPPSKHFLKPNFYLFNLFAYSFFIFSCSSSSAIGSDKTTQADGKEICIQTVQADPSYKGWDFLVNKLIVDGIPKNSVDAVFKSDLMPAMSFIPFKLNPVETTQMYNRMTSQDRLDRAANFMAQYKDSFAGAEAKFGVTKYVIAAIISVETNWGSYTGDEIILNRLARIASTGEPNNLILNFRKLNREDSSVTLEQAKARSEYLFKTFYPHVLALFHSFKANPQDILKLKGSVAGAFGLPQFLPKSYEDFGVDGNKDNVIDLFQPKDAIYSVANFLKAHGWRKLLSPQDKLAVLWHYNRSEAYGRAVIRVALSLQNRDINYN